MMTDLNEDLRIDVLLSLQRALLGMVTPDLRAVEVAIEGRDVRGRFIYDGEITEEHRELVDEVETLLIADMEHDVKARLEAIAVPSPAPVALVRGTDYCYLRRET
jgi:hypothetical protein